LDNCEGALAVSFAMLLKLENVKNILDRINHQSNMIWLTEIGVLCVQVRT
jgi:hypothetical protein